MIVRGDAFHLPFPDRTFDIIVADPPYDIGKNKAGRGKRGISVRPYVGFKSRAWWAEAWRVLNDTGRLYVVCAVQELDPWIRTVPVRYSDLLAWHAPNAVSIAAKYAKAQGRRAYTWRPIIEWTKPGAGPLQNPDGLCHGNSLSHSLISYPAHESLPWPNQLPLAVATWLLAPIPGSLVLDLFAGTGTTRVAAEGLGLTAVSVELAPEAIAINQQRPAPLTLPRRPFQLPTPNITLDDLYPVRRKPPCPTR